MDAILDLMSLGQNPQHNTVQHAAPQPAYVADGAGTVDPSLISLGRLPTGALPAAPPFPPPFAPQPQQDAHFQQRWVGPSTHLPASSQPMQADIPALPSLGGGSTYLAMQSDETPSPWQSFDSVSPMQSNGSASSPLLPQSCDSASPLQSSDSVWPLQQQGQVAIPAYYPVAQDVCSAPLPPFVPALVAARAPTTPPSQPEARRAPGPIRTSRPAARKDKPVQACGQAGCDYKTANKEELRRHRESVHQGIRRHRCEQCSASYNDASGLSKHKQSDKHKGRCRELGLAFTDTVFECPECRRRGQEVRVPRADQLKRHLLSHCPHSGHALPAGFSAGTGGMNLAKVVVEVSGRLPPTA
jgi:hypothetical protein